MKKIAILLLVFITLHEYKVNAQNCTTDIIITTGVASGERDYNASNTITTNTNTVVIGNTATVNYKAGTSITLGPGFEVKEGAEFSALIEACIPSPFTMRISVTNTPNTSITLPTHTSAGSSYTIDWGDLNTSTQNGSGFPTHSYSSAGTYTIEISGNLERIQCFEFGGFSNYEIIEIEEWGDIAWQSMYGAFAGQGSLVIDTNAGEPNLSSVITTAWMFYYCSTMNSSTVKDWDVSKVENMSSMFRDATDFNQDLGGWDVKNVTNMSAMLDDTNMGGANYENTLIGWNNQTLQKKVTLGASGRTYCGAIVEAARDSLVSSTNHDWTILGDSNTCRPFNSMVSEDLTVYPNPGKKTIHINLINAGYRNAFVSILDMSGRIVFKGIGKEELDVSHLRNGVYLIEILHEKQRQVVQFIKE